MEFALLLFSIELEEKISIGRKVHFFLLHMTDQKGFNAKLWEVK